MQRAEGTRETRRVKAGAQSFDSPAVQLHHIGLSPQGRTGSVQLGSGRHR